jgi:hypothetical protein
MIAVKSGRFYFVFGERFYVVDETLAPYFPFPNDGEIVDVEDDGGPVLIPAFEKARRWGIFLGVKEIVFPSGKKFQIGTTGKSIPVDADFYLEFLPNYVAKIRRRISRGSLSQEKKSPTLFSW